MDRSRSKRYYYNQDYDSEALPRTKQRYNSHHSSSHHYSPSHHRRYGGGKRNQDDSLSVTTSYRILCHDLKAGGVIGKSGSIIKDIRQHTGAWINVHELVTGDEERIIEISDSRRRDPEGRIPPYSPAQEALILIHERILESEPTSVGVLNNVRFGGDEDEEYGPRGGGSRVVTRLVVPRRHVGCLMGKGGKIIEQMRVETKTHIRILPRDHTLPRCVAMSDEIVQVVGEMNSVKDAIKIISSRLRESQLRDRGPYGGRLHSPERLFPPEDDFPHQMNSVLRRKSLDYGARGRSSNSASHQPGCTNDSNLTADNAQSISDEELVFRILCPIGKVDSVVGEADGIVELLQNEVGVDVKVVDLVRGSDEQIIVISSDEGLDDELFPAQEALLHIQSRIVDLVPEKENIITTRLVLSSAEVGFLGAKNGVLSEMRKTTGANILILPREELPACLSTNDELVEIVGEIKAAREAVVEVTSRLRSCLYQELFQNDAPNPPVSAPSPVRSTSTMEAASSIGKTPQEACAVHDNIPSASSQNVQNSVTSLLPPKDLDGPGGELVRQRETCDDVPSGKSRIPVTLVTRSTLEVVIPQYAVPKLITKSKNRLAQISELSGANVKLMDDRPEATENIIQISGTPDQAERAQSLIQGFILSIQEDGP